MKLRIESEGKAHTTRVMNAETGEILEGVREVTWHCAVGGFATVEIKLMNVHVSVAGLCKAKPRRRIEA